MNKKKIVFDVLVILFAFILFVFWYENNIKRKYVPAASIDGDVVYLITMDKSNQFWGFINNGASDMAQLLGIKYVWLAPEKRIAQDQIELINEAINAGADAILISVINPVVVDDALNKAKAQGIKIVYVDNPANVEAVITFGTDNYEAGAVAALTMIDQLEAIGASRGTIGIVGSEQNMITTLERERGFRDTIINDGKFQLLDTIYYLNDPIAAEQELNSIINNTANLVGLFATDEITSQIIGKSIGESNKYIIGIGFDMTKELQTMLRNGYLRAVIDQNPYTMGYLGMAEAYAALRGFETGPDYIYTGIEVVTH